MLSTTVAPGALVLTDSIPFSAAPLDDFYPWPLAMMSPLAALKWNRKSWPRAGVRLHAASEQADDDIGEPLATLAASVAEIP